eukprot:335265-Pyramimonas_sp.AAC.1
MCIRDRRRALPLAPRALRSPRIRARRASNGPRLVLHCACPARPPAALARHVAPFGRRIVIPAGETTASLRTELLRAGLRRTVVAHSTSLGQPLSGMVVLLGSGVVALRAARRSRRGL